MHSHHTYMDEALTLAKKAALQDEVPVGALVVDEAGIIISHGYNQVEKEHTQRAHAEMNTLEAAGKRRLDWRLVGCTLYVTLEPCGMCMHMALLSRVSTIVWGATSPLYGYQLDMNIMVWLYKNDGPQIVTGIREGESAALLQDFFNKKRKDAREQHKT